MCIDGQDAHERPSRLVAGKPMTGTQERWIEQMLKYLLGGSAARGPRLTETAIERIGQINPR